MPLRFLVDLCVGRRVAEWLSAQGHDVRSVEEPDPGDWDVLAWAFRDERVLITADKDFGKLIYVDRQAHAGLVRLPNVLAAERIEIIDQVILRHADDLSRHAVITCDGQKIRISLAPRDEIHEGEVIYYLDGRVERH